MLGLGLGLVLGLLLGIIEGDSEGERLGFVAMVGLGLKISIGRTCSYVERSSV